ncbi:MAG: hypothetical protein IJC51_00025 [Eggerthellaceae bacterium]|nr:hypothetical protein [Eggerthellaceae bacterium]
MKVAAPATQDKTSVDDFFGRASYFAVLDTETGAIEFHENPAVDAESGAGVKAAQAIFDLGCEAICMPQVGKNAQDALVAGGVTVYRNVDTALEASLWAMAKGELEELVDAHGGFHWAR